MSSALVVALVSCAAVYRVAVSLTRPPTVWRTALTVAIVCAALGAAMIFYGDPLDRLVAVPNLSKLLVHLVLLAAAAGTLVFVATTNAAARPLRAVVGPVLAAAAVSVVQVAAWSSAPFHDDQLTTIAGVASLPSVALFEGSFIAMLLPTSLVNARFCAARALRRPDPPTRISLALTAGASAAAGLVFSLYAVVIVLIAVDSPYAATVMRFSDAVPPTVVAVLGLATLVLLVAPGLQRWLTSVRQLRALRPLWRDLVTRHPQVHLDAVVTGGPVGRLEHLVQRRVVETYDALRLTRVAVPPGVGVAELGRALRRADLTGGNAANVVLEEAPSGAEGELRLLQLAAAYARTRPWPPSPQEGRPRHEPA